jgi:hypothetical protein
MKKTRLSKKPVNGAPITPTLRIYMNRILIQQIRHATKAAGLKKVTG